MLRLTLVLLILGLTATSAHAQRFVKVFDNLAALVAANPNDVHTNVVVVGRTTANDGEGGLYTWNSTSTAATNANGVILKATGFSTGRWFRQVGFTIYNQISLGSGTAFALDPNYTRYYGAVTGNTTVNIATNSAAEETTIYLDLYDSVGGRTVTLSSAGTGGSSFSGAVKDFGFGTNKLGTNTFIFRKSGGVWHAEQTTGQISASQIGDGFVSDIVFSYLTGTTSNIQSQINALTGITANPTDGVVPIRASATSLADSLILTSTNGVTFVTNRLGVSQALYSGNNVATVWGTPGNEALIAIRVPGLNGDSGSPELWLSRNTAANLTADHSFIGGLPGASSSTFTVGARTSGNTYSILMFANATKQCIQWTLPTATSQDIANIFATPEGNVTAGPGSTYRNMTGSGTVFWTKNSGTGNTGWAEHPSGGIYPFYVLNTTNIGFDGVFVWGPGTTNAMYRSGNNIVITNGGGTVNLQVKNPSGTAAMETFGGNAYFRNLAGNAVYFINQNNAGFLVASDTVVAPTSDNAISLGGPSSSSRWSDIGATTLYAISTGGANYERLSIAATTTTNGMIYNTEAGGAGTYRNHTFQIGGTNILQITPTGIIGGGGGGEVNTGSNIGGGPVGVFSGKVGVDLQFNTLQSGGNVTISSNASIITIGATGEANTGSNLGSGVGVFNSKSAVDFQFNTLLGAGGITWTSNANQLTATLAPTNWTVLAISDPATVLATSATNYFTIPASATLKYVTATLLIPSSSGAVTVELGKNGTTVLSAPISISAGATNAAGSLSVTSVAALDRLVGRCTGAGTTAYGLQLVVGYTTP